MDVSYETNPTHVSVLPRVWRRGGGEMTNVLISSILSSTVLDVIWCLNKKQWSETHIDKGVLSH